MDSFGGAKAGEKESEKFLKEEALVVRMRLMKLTPNIH